MKILHVISSLDISKGGPSKSVSDLARNQAILGHNVFIMTVVSPSPYLVESEIKGLSIIFVSNWLFFFKLRELLKKSSFDIIHGHGIWQLPLFFMAVLARRYSIPYIISPRGMLEPWALNQGFLKKKIAMYLYQRNILRNSYCIHSTGLKEEYNLRNMELCSSYATIPNGIDLKEFPLIAPSVSKKEKVLLFLSRIHPKKGVEILIEVWSKVDVNLKRNWKVEIIGNGSDSYLRSLTSLIKDKGLETEICIKGPLFGVSKLESYYRADLFVLPTYSENFGIVVAEALACRVPVITTSGTPWVDLNTYNAGWYIDIGVNPLIEILNKVLKLDDFSRIQMGNNGRTLIENKYSIESVAFQMINLYSWILKKGPKPEFVYE